MHLLVSELYVFQNARCSNKNDLLVVTTKPLCCMHKYGGFNCSHNKFANRASEFLKPAQPNRSCTLTVNCVHVFRTSIWHPRPVYF